MKVHEFEKIVNKLGMETRNSSDRHAWLVHNGVTIVRTRRSHGDGKYIPEDKIRQQLKVNEGQFFGLISCAVSKQDYLDILTKKGVIPTPKITFRVFEEPSHRHLGDLEFDREIQKDECIAHDASVYRVQWVRMVGPATDNRRDLHVFETIDTAYIARIA